MSLSLGAAKLPLRHLSIRVPWHDTGWDGTFCRYPAGNASCLILKRIREERSDGYELEHAGESWIELENPQRPPCHAENASFMLPREQVRLLTHAYVNSSPAHAHLAPTPIELPPYAAAAVPFRWMLRENTEAISEQAGTYISHELEEQADGHARFNSSWIQDGRNQRVLLDSFFNAIKPEKSLVFFYAKRTPLSEDTRRVIVGVGRVNQVGAVKEFQTREPGPFPTMVWERTVQHSIRPDLADGFLLPYHQMLELSAADPSIELDRYVAFAPDDHWTEFSYGAEQVGHDAAITALLNCAAALRECAKKVGGDWETPLDWIDARLNELWRMRGPCPGLGSALTAFGIEHGNFLAYDLASVLEENADPWPTVEEAFRNPALLGLGLEKRISPTMVDVWQKLPDERRSLLKLLSRFDISADQAKRFYQGSERRAKGIEASDADLLENPYLLFEQDRANIDPFTLRAVDRGVFPDPVVREQHPLPEPSAINDPADWRRVRALAVAALETASGDGDTLRSRDQVIGWISDVAISPKCPIGEDLLNAVEERFPPVIKRVELADGRPAYQLGRLDTMGRLISGTVGRRLRGRRFEVVEDWGARLAERLPRLESLSSDEREIEERARQEKVAALTELAASRFSVLIGPAGTGKTLLLSVLCSHPSVRAGGILLLAPTGKARVRLGQATKLPTKTVAEFLVGVGGYDGETGTYRLTDREPVDAGRTVIIDEASMLTEEQLAATIQAIKLPDRIILVGDPRQLPPIGSGRPFVDIVAHLRPAGIEGTFPRVGQGFTELTIRRRQTGNDRDDLMLAEWFSGEEPGPGADEIWNRIEHNIGSDRIRLIPWEAETDLREQLIGALVEELKLNGSDDEIGFGVSLGGSPYGNSVFYWRKKGNDGAGAGERVEDWQILSPVRGRAYGTMDLNRVIQRQFRRGTLEYAEHKWRKIPKPMGIEEIVYGDKVIQTTNQRRKRVFPEEGALKYVANGEIGIAVGQYKTKSATYKGYPWKLEVEFSSQVGFSYDYTKGEFGEDGSPPLELAYAITVHKAQGSEFGTTFLILPKRERAYSRELLYTSLTRQRERVVILHQGELSDLKALADPHQSETARRLTNLFRPPTLLKFDDLFLEGNLIHRTRRGKAVRSKSEVIVADALQDAGLDYEYERRLIAVDDSIRYPDFTIEDAELGQTIYWEHLGMLEDPGYARRWNDKLAWYRDQDILPFEQGGGSNGVLVVSRDTPAGGIDSAAIADLIDKVFGR